MSTRSVTPPRPGRQPANGSTSARASAKASAGQVQSLTRGLSILAALARADGGLTLTDIAHRVGLAPSTTHRLLATLEATGYAHQSADLGHWYVGLQSFRVGTAFLANRDFVGQSHPYLRRLMEQAGETANLAILDGHEAVFIAQVQCREMMRLVVKLGSRVPLHASGVGKAIFAALPDERIDEVIASTGLPAITATTITDPAAMRASIRVIRHRGYSFDDEEHALGTRCVGAAIYDEHAEPLGALSLAGPSSRLTDDRIRKLGPVVAHTAEELTRRLGGRWPHPW